MLTNPIEQFNELHRKKSLATKLKPFLVVILILSIGLTASYIRNNALNKDSVIVVGRVTKVNPTSIYYEFLHEGSTRTGAYDFSRGYHNPRKPFDLLIIQFSASTPKYQRVLNKKENIDPTSKYYSQIIEDIEPIRLKWWQH